MGRASHRDVLLEALQVALGSARADVRPETFGPAAEAERFLALARAAGVAPLVHAASVRAHRLHLPLPVRAALVRDYDASARRYGRLRLHLEPVITTFAAEAIPVAVLKGMALAESAYGDPALRPMQDVDLLVRPCDVERATAALARLGYEPPDAFSQERAWRVKAMFAPRASTPGLIVDLHWSLVDHKAAPVARRWATAAHERLEPMGPAMPWVLRLSPADALVHAAVHLALNHGLAGLLGYCDVAAIACRWPGAIDWERLVTEVRDARLVGPVGFVLATASALLAAPVPEPVLGALSPRRASRAALARAAVVTPGALAVRGIPVQQYLVPVLLADRARDAAGIVIRHLMRRGSRPAVP